MNIITNANTTTTDTIITNVITNTITIIIIDVNVAADVLINKVKLNVHFLFLRVHF